MTPQCGSQPQASECQQHTIEFLNRQPHDIKVGATDAGDADIAYIFLYAIGSGLVEWLVVGDIVPVTT